MWTVLKSFRSVTHGDEGRTLYTYLAVCTKHTAEYGIGIMVVCYAWLQICVVNRSQMPFSADKRLPRTTVKFGHSLWGPPLPVCTSNNLLLYCYLLLELTANQVYSMSTTKRPTSTVGLRPRYLPTFLLLAFVNTTELIVRQCWWTAFWSVNFSETCVVCVLSTPPVQLTVDSWTSQLTPIPPRSTLTGL